MSVLLARLGPVKSANTRVIFARGDWHEYEVGPELRRLPEGQAVFLVGGPPWTEFRHANMSPWPARLGPVKEVWARRSGKRQVHIEPLLASRGLWTWDDEGKPCELGLQSSLLGAAAVTVVSYAGWPISEFPGEVTVWESTGADGTSVWIVLPDAVPRSGAVARILPARASNAPRPAEQPPEQPPVPPRPEPRRVEVPRARPFSLRLKLVDLEFADGFVSFQLGGRISLPTPHARLVYQPVRDLLDEHLPGGVIAEGQVTPDGSVTGEIRGLERLSAIFVEVEYKRLVRDAGEATTWIDADSLAERLHREKPEDLLGIPEIGLGRRMDAFRLLFTRRDPAERVRLLPRSGVLVPLPARDGGPRWYAWETVQGELATYLFRPNDPSAMERMLAWTQTPNVRRRELLGNPTMRRDLGFVDRVEHVGEGEDPLGRWWRELREKVGL